MIKLKSVSFSILAILISIGFAACSGDNDSDDTQKILIENFSQGDLTFTEQGGEQSFSFTANSSWTVTVSSNGGDTSWCTVYPSSGGKGTQTVRVSTTANTSYDDRNATITLTSGTQTKSFVVTQKQKDAILFTSDKFEIDKAGGTITIEVKSNVSYTATIGEECKDWIKEGSGTRGLTTTTKIYTISPSEEAEKREGTITFTDGTLSETVHVYQTGGYSVVLNQRSYVIDEKGGSITVELRSNCDYDVIMPDVDWIKEDKTRSMSSHTLYYNILANTTYDSREAIIIYKDKKDLVRDTLTVTQAQLNAVVLVDKNLSIGSVGGTVEAKVKSNVSYEVVMPDADWISRVPKTRGLTESVEQFTVKPNSSHDDRSANIIFKTSDNKSDTLVVTQSQLDAIILTNKSVTLEYNSTTIDVKVMSNVNYEVMIPSDVDWVKVASKTRGLAESTVQLAINRNSTIESRSANIIFKSGDNVKDTLSITQAERNAFVISNSDVNVGYEGGTIDVKIRSNVDFYVWDLPKWIKIAPKSRALTESTLQFIIDENTGKEDRSGKIWICSDDYDNGALEDYLTVTQASKIVEIKIPGGGLFNYTCEKNGKPQRVKVYGGLWYSDLKEAAKNCGFTYLDLSEVTMYDDNLPVSHSYKTDVWNSTLQGNSTLKTIILPNYIKTIGSNAFSNCVRNVVLPNTLTEIKSYAFQRSDIENIVIPDSVKKIGAHAFEYSDLSSIVLPKGLESIGEYAFAGCSKLSSLPEGIPEIGRSMFEKSGVKNIVIPNSIKEIGEYAFSECSNLSSVVIQEGVKSIGQYAFYKCPNLPSVVIPDGVTDIGRYAFQYCTNLSSVVIKGGKEIGSYTFEGCSKLSSVVLPEGITYIAGSMFKKTGIKDITIPSTVTTIGADAFYGCESLRSVIFPENLRSIGTEAFMNCFGLSISLPDSLRTIGDCAFCGCEINPVSIPAKVTSIGKSAFKSYSFKTCYIYAETPPDINRTEAYASFQFMWPNVISKLYVPKGCRSVYIDNKHYWNTIFKEVYEMEE